MEGSSYCTCGMPKYRSHTTRSNAMQGQQRNLINLRPISCKQHSIHHLVPTTTSLLHNHCDIHGNGSQNETHRTNNSTPTRRNPNQGHPPRSKQRIHTHLSQMHDNNHYHLTLKRSVPRVRVRDRDRSVR